MQTTRDYCSLHNWVTSCRTKTKSNICDIWIFCQDLVPSTLFLIFQPSKDLFKSLLAEHLMWSFGGMEGGKPNKKIHLALCLPAATVHSLVWGLTWAARSRATKLSSLFLDNRKLWVPFHPWSMPGLFMVLCQGTSCSHFAFWIFHVQCHDSTNHDTCS